MTCNEAKKISVVSVLNKIGTVKVKETNREIWYLSPFRKEDTASFKVDIRKNIWYDHGEGIGGNVLDLVMRFHNCDIREALGFIGKESFSFHQPIFSNLAHEKENKYQIISVSTIANSKLVSYIENRKMCLSMTRKYCREVHYMVNSKIYFGIGFENIDGGFEIRNKYIKMALFKKTISIFLNGRKRVILFESWSDFISFLTLYPQHEFEYDFIVLNSVSNLKKLFMQKDNCTNVYLRKYVNIICCFDNDIAGEKATNMVQKLFPDFFKDGRNRYKNHKDLNDYLMTQSV